MNKKKNDACKSYEILCKRYKELIRSDINRGIEKTTLRGGLTRLFVVRIITYEYTLIIVENYCWKLIFNFKAESVSL